MCNLYTKFVKFLEICKEFSEDLVTESGNVRRPGLVPRFSDLEVIALSMAAEAEEIDSENWLFEAKLKESRSSIPNLISRRQFNDRRKEDKRKHHDEHFPQDLENAYELGKRLVSQCQIQKNPIPTNLFY